MAIHLVLLLLAALFLPLKINGLLGDPDPAAPIGWLLATLALSVGAPFAVLSATAPLLQAWYARVRVGHADGQNPYVLYAASNLGSFLALLAYPVLIEPLMTLSGQRAGLERRLCRLHADGRGPGRRRPGGAARSRRRAARRSTASPPIPWREKGVLVLLAAAPSSLMLGVTAHLSTDVASAPFLWVIPLALYLLTFVIAFQDQAVDPAADHPGASPARRRRWSASPSRPSGPATGSLMFGLHLATFFFAGPDVPPAAGRAAPAAGPADRVLSADVAGRRGRRRLHRLAGAGDLQHGVGVSAGAGARRPGPAAGQGADQRTGRSICSSARSLVAGLPPLLSAVFQADWGCAWWFNDNVSRRHAAA